MRNFTEITVRRHQKDIRRLRMVFILKIIKNKKIND